MLLPLALAPTAPRSAPRSTPPPPSRAHHASGCACADARNALAATESDRNSTLRVVVVTPTTNRDDHFVPAVASAVRATLLHAQAFGYLVEHRIYLRRMDGSTCTLWTRFSPHSRCICIANYEQHRREHSPVIPPLFSRMFREAAADADVVAIIESDVVPQADTLSLMVSAIVSRRADVVAVPFGFAKGTGVAYYTSNGSGIICTHQPQYDGQLKPAWWMDFGCLAMVPSASLLPMPITKMSCTMPHLVGSQNFVTSGFDVGWVKTVARGHRTRILDQRIRHLRAGTEHWASSSVSITKGGICGECSFV